MEDKRNVFNILLGTHKKTDSIRDLDTDVTII